MTMTRTGAEPNDSLFMKSLLLVVARGRLMTFDAGREADAQFIESVERNDDQHEAEDVGRRDDRRDDEQHHEGVAAVSLQKGRGDQPHAGQEVDQQRQLEDQRRGDRGDDHRREVLPDVDHVDNRGARLVVDEEAHREGHQYEIAEQQPGEEEGRGPEDEAVRGGDFAGRERRAHEAPELPQHVGHGQHEPRDHRDLHVEVELPGHLRVDDAEIEVRDVEGLRIDAQGEPRPGVDPRAQVGERMPGGQQQAVGREVGALGAEQHRLDQKVLREEGHDGHDDHGHGTAHQMGAQRREMVPEAHLHVGGFDPSVSHFTRFSLGSHGGADAPRGLLPGRRGLVIRLLRGVLLLLLGRIVRVHGILELLDAAAQSAHQLGNLPAAEEQQHHENDNQNLAVSDCTGNEHGLQKLSLTW